jgi:hypothetical protein
MVTTTTAMMTARYVALVVTEVGDDANRCRLSLPPFPLASWVLPALSLFSSKLMI